MPSILRIPHKGQNGWWLYFGYLTKAGPQRSMKMPNGELGYFATKKECLEKLKEYELKELKRLKRKYKT